MLVNVDACRPRRHFEIRFLLDGFSNIFGTDRDHGATVGHGFAGDKRSWAGTLDSSGPMTSNVLEAVAIFESGQQLALKGIFQRDEELSSLGGFLGDMQVTSDGHNYVGQTLGVGIQEAGRAAPVASFKPDGGRGAVGAALGTAAGNAVGSIFGSGVARNLAASVGGQ